MLKFLGSVSGVALLLVGLTAGGASASPITVPNFSFELPNCSVSCIGGFYSPTITSWGQSGDSGVSQNTGGAFSSLPDGNQFAYTNHASITLDNSTSSGAFNNKLAAGTYTLSVYVGNSNTNHGAGSATIDLLAGGSVDSFSLAALPAFGSFVQYTLTDVVTAGDPRIGSLLGIKLDGSTAATGQVDFDKVTLNFAGPTGVPEPVTLSIFGAGLAGIAVIRRRRKAKNT